MSSLYSDAYTEAAAAFDRSDLQTAYDLLYPLADAGEARAQYHLGLLHFQGWRVPGEYRTGYAWIKKAAEQGYAAAQANLGNLYRIGMVVSQDDIHALAWFSLAAKQGDRKADKRRHELANKMTATQRLQAQHLIEQIEQKRLFGKHRQN